MDQDQTPLAEPAQIEQTKRPPGRPRKQLADARCAVCYAPMPCAEHDRPAIDLPDDPPVLKAEVSDAPDMVAEEPSGRIEPGTLEELHARIRAARAPKPEYTPPPPTPRQQAQINAEMEAGRRASERAAAQQANRPLPVKDPTEGSTSSVHRPGKFDEYRGSFKSPAQTASKG
jgi:hypothetical protein